MGTIDPAVLTLLRHRLEGIERSGLRLPMRHELFIGRCNAPIDKA